MHNTHEGSVYKVQTCLDNFLRCGYFYKLKFKPEFSIQDMNESGNITMLFSLNKEVALLD